MLQEYVIPLTGLPEFIHQILFLFVISIIGSMLTAYLFPKYLTVFFFKIKRKVFRRYQDGYVDNVNISTSKKCFLKRAFYSVLLLAGLLAFIVPNIRESASLFLSADTLKNFAEMGIYPGYSLIILVTLVGVLIPIVIGIWSAGWVMEDVGLMHYRIQDERKGKESYEIEPIHMRYNNFVKGYAGISSFLFIIQVAYSFASVLHTYPDRISDVFGVIILPFCIIILMIPAYIVYIKTSDKTKNLRNNLPLLKQLNKEDILQK